jgi:hypothetical protein
LNVTSGLISAPANIALTAGSNDWTFAADGNLIFPTGMHITSDGYGGTRISLNSNVADIGLRISAGNTNAFASIGWARDEIPGVGPVATIAFNLPVSQSNAQIITGNLSATQYRWTFDDSGNLTLPSNLILPGNITGTGASPAPSINGFDTINAITLSASGNVTGGNVLTVGAVKTGSFVTGTIPAASGVGAGARAFVTDADSITFGNLYVGGAANAMPVWSNGTNWYIG